MKSFKDIYKGSENKIAGIAAAPGIVIGEVYLFTKEKLEISKADITDVEEAKINFHEALTRSKKELTKVFAIARDRMGDTRAAIFEAQLMILDDPILIGNIIKRIESIAFVNISSWESIKQAIDDCEVESVWQLHNRTVRAKLKNGEELAAVEPELDDIIDLAIAAEPKCGEILMGTE